ncbi:hypothetical protein SAMN05660420_01763 [Desulfuromusa kysingii]|uniref:Uncharacterized protein n=1 Tax=Desulfuromusa kysingii TaxID=37625 RepID=A0A1H4A210_9BACT|nr:hypothetical protein SAMN05660420_01763 [Desulfuromusa kysingii]
MRESVPINFPGAPNAIAKMVPRKNIVRNLSNDEEVDHLKALGELLVSLATSAGAYASAFCSRRSILTEDLG